MQDVYSEHGLAAGVPYLWAVSFAVPFFMDQVWAEMIVLQLQSFQGLCLWENLC